MSTGQQVMVCHSGWNFCIVYIPNVLPLFEYWINEWMKKKLNFEGVLLRIHFKTTTMLRFFFILSLYSFKMNFGRNGTFYSDFTLKIVQQKILTR